jgi:hypothetical protein
LKRDFTDPKNFLCETKEKEMAALKKSFLVLAVVLMALAGASGTAYGQHPFGGLVTCVANAAPSLVRAEGIAEIQGDIVLVCTTSSTTGLPASILTNFNVTLNVNVTNFNLGGGLRDAVLLVNENTTAPPSGTPTVTTSPAGQTAQYATASGNIGLAWNGVNFPVPGSGTNPTPTTVRITNIRANVSQLGIPTGDNAFPTAQVTAFLSITGTTNVSITNNVLNIGTPLLGLVATYRGTQFTSSLPTVARQCIGQNISSGAVTVCGVSDACSTFTIRVSEGFATAFKTLGFPTNFPGLTQVEDGYTTPGDGVNNGGATQGTRFIFRFYNVPSGVRLASPNIVTGTVTPPSFGGPAHTLTLVKVSNTDANGAGALIPALGASTEITITNGFGFVVYEVVDDNPFVIESAIVPFTAGYVSNTANNLPAVGTMQASVSFAPLSTVTTSDTVSPRPRFVDTGSPKSVFSITRCLTNLLFPFVTNIAGFDTGFAIANTSADDKGTVAQSGTCTLFYFGSTAGGGAAPAQQTTSSPVAAGQTITWTLSGGNSTIGITGTPGFQGYIFAQCQFQFAHGFAFITNGFGGVPTLAEGYLALVVPWDGVPGSRGAMLAGSGESLMH